ncbi:retrovirus-related pol polyprotein from transposon TNT 1-94 [Tanacetum coccineum]
MTRVNMFVDMDTESVKESSKKVEMAQESSSKRAGDELEQEKEKKQKIDDDEAEMKKHMEIVPDDEVAIDAIPLATKPPIIVEWKIIKEGKMGYFQIIRADGSSRMYSLMIKMLQIKIEAPWELPTVSLVITSLKKLKYHVGQFDNVVKKRITPDAFIEGECGFEHTKAIFLKEIIAFVKTLKDIFNVFDKDLINECFEIQKKQFLIENDRLLDQIISQDIMNIVMNSSLDKNTSVNVNSFVTMNDSVNYVEMCNKCLELEAELIKQLNMVEKDEYNRLSKSFSKLEQHCISLELAMQLHKEIFQKNNTSVNQTESSFDQLFELNNLKAELQSKDTTIKKLKANIKRLNKTSTTNNVKKYIDEIETINIELEHRSVDVTDLNAQLQEKVFVITALKNDFRKLKGKDIVDNATQVSNATTITPGMYKLDLIILAPKVKNNREAHEYYLKHTLEQAAILRELLGYVGDTCPNIHKPSEKLVVITPINKKKTVQVADTVTSSGNIPKVTNRPLLSSTGVNPSTSASGSNPPGNTKNDRIPRTPSSNEKNKVEVQSRKVKSSLNKKNSDSKNACNEHVKHPVKGAKALCSICNECLFDANNAVCLIDHVNSMNVRAKSAFKKNKKRKEWKPTRKVLNSVGYKWKPTGRTFTLVGNGCPLTRLTATHEVPLRVPIPLDVVAPKHVVTRVYTRRPKVPKSVQKRKPKVAKSMTANRMEPGTSWGSDTSVAPSSSSLIDCRLSKLFCGIWILEAPRHDQRSLSAHQFLLLNKIPFKEKDPGSFTIPCVIGKMGIDKALADLGAIISLMPYSMYARLDLGEVKPTHMCIELANNSAQYPRAIAENVIVKIDKFIFLVDFVVLDMKEDHKIPIILGRPFLATAHAMIDVFNKKNIF